MSTTITQSQIESLFEENPVSGPHQGFCTPSERFGAGKPLLAKIDYE